MVSSLNWQPLTHFVFICSKSNMATPVQGLKYAQS